MVMPLTRSRSSYNAVPEMMDKITSVNEAGEGSSFYMMPVNPPSSKEHAADLQVVAHHQGWAVCQRENQRVQFFIHDKEAIAQSAEYNSVEGLDAYLRDGNDPLHDAPTEASRLCRETA